MSRPERRAELAAQFEAEWAAREAEEQRVAGLSMYDRISELSDMHDVRAFLHILVDRLGLD